MRKSTGLILSLLIINSAGCSYQAIRVGDRVVRKRQYSIGMPSGVEVGGVWKADLMRDGKNLIHREAGFLYCPGHQVIVLDELAEGGIAGRRRLKNPLGLVPFAILAESYLESSFQIRSSTSAPPTLLSISTGSLAGSPIVDAVYLHTTSGLASCQDKSKSVRTYKKRFIVIDMTFKPFAWTRPRIVVLRYESPEDGYDKHVIEFENWAKTFRDERVMPN